MCRSPDARWNPCGSCGKAKSAGFVLALNISRSETCPLSRIAQARAFSFGSNQFGNPQPAQPLDFGVCIEPFFAQYRMRAAKGNHSAGKTMGLPMPFQISPVKPTVSLS
jgi:hypothetical protein